MGGNPVCRGANKSSAVAPENVTGAGKERQADLLTVRFDCKGGGREKKKITK